MASSPRGQRPRCYTLQERYQAVLQLQRVIRLYLPDYRGIDMIGL